MMNLRTTANLIIETKGLIFYNRILKIEKGQENEQEGFNC